MPSSSTLATAVSILRSAVDRDDPVDPADPAELEDAGQSRMQLGMKRNDPGPAALALPNPEGGAGRYPVKGPEPRSPAPRRS